MGVRKHFHFSTVVWGPWHTGVFLDVNLTSLVAPDNLAAFAKLHDVTYRIFTRAEDVPRIEASPGYRLAKQVVQFELIAVPIDGKTDPIAIHHILWRRSIDEAREAGAMILLVPPDVIWSNGAFRHIAEVAATGKTAIFATYVRVVTETAVPAVQRLYQDKSTSVIAASSRELVKVCMEHMHPLALTYVRDSPNFPVHPELILWPVAGQGYLMRHLVREMFAYDPHLYDLNRLALLAHKPAPADIHYITDSDDLFSLSLTPMMKDIEWFAKPRHVDPLEIGAWWLRYDSPANDITAAQNFYIHNGGRSDPAWRRAERCADALIRQLQGSRDALGILSQLGAHNLRAAEQAVALALSETRLALLARCEGPITALLPRPEAIDARIAVIAPRIGDPKVKRELMDQLLDHVLIGHLPLTSRQEMTFPTARGGLRRLKWRRELPVIDGVPMRLPGTALGVTWGYEVADILPRSAQRTDAAHVG